MEKDTSKSIGSDPGSPGPSRAPDDLAAAKAERMAGYRGRSSDDVLEDMERILAEAEAAQAERVLRS